MPTAAEKTPPTAVRYVEGDATAPEGPGTKIIAHCCNNVGVWGAGFVMALSRRWDRPEGEYRAWAERQGSRFQALLGAMQLVPVESDVMVANIVGQNGVVGRTANGEIPVRYEAIAKGFGFIAKYAKDHPEKTVSVHMPRIGCALAGGSWAEIEPLIDRAFVTNQIPVTVYDWPGGRFNP
jgi:O-acetyl-ADP-ribose deacetylase (regulator of RNase III)